MTTADSRSWHWPSLNTSPVLAINDDTFTLSLAVFLSLVNCLSQRICIMRWCLSFLLLCFLAVVHAVSSSGNRLVVILEEAAEKELYSSFWEDLQGDFLNLYWLLLNCADLLSSWIYRFLRIAQEQPILAVRTWRESLRPSTHPPSQVERLLPCYGIGRG